MKKIIIICLTLGVLAGGIMAQEKKEPIASVTMSFGEVYIKSIDKKDWEITKVGMYVYEGDKMRTKDTGKVEVMFLNGSIVFLGNDTEMEFLNEEEKDGDTNSLFLFFGSVWNKVTEGSNYDIESVHALATVRGTYFNVSVKDVMEVWVKEGQVDVENQYGKVEAKENTYVKVSETVAPIKEDVKESEFPEEVTFESDVEIEMNIPTQIFKEDWQKVTGIIRKKNESSLYLEPIEITVTASDSLYLKTKKKKKKTRKTLLIEPKNGKFEFFVLTKEGNENFTLSSSKTTSKTYYVTANEAVTKKDVLVEFWGKDGEMRRIKATFEKQ
ncbi:hypothetical protein CL647_02720 [bacterium]|nr:hypothetical protein [Actinomycetota bacterium]MBE33023.1 hypothetical protein [bacterium]|tara:strand:- start:8202 stop:9182 length:981 start_codon:yes stop_codon:yes gene_type:complete